MRRLFFLLTLGLYGFGAMDLHEWAHVPQSILHWVQHHTDMGHHDEETGHHHDEHGDHDPFGCDEHGTCTAFALVGMVMEPHALRLDVPEAAQVRAVTVDEGALSAFSGSKWNPPKA